MKLLINSTVLSNFAAITRLPLLHSLYGTVHIAQAVYEEAQDGLEEGYTFLESMNTSSPFIRMGGCASLISKTKKNSTSTSKLRQSYTGEKRSHWRSQRIVNGNF